MSKNVRYENGHRRRKHRDRFKAMNAPCGICGGRYGPIRYDQPSNHLFPLSFVIDEIIPVSRAVEFGYSSPRQAAEDWNNLQAAHYICNSKKSNKLNFHLDEVPRSTGQAKKNDLVSIADGDW